MASEEKVRIGVIGVGGMGSSHCRSARERVEEVELAAVVDTDAERAQQIGEQFGVPWFCHHKELLDKDLVDAVVIATPHYFHPPIAVDAFRAGLHVLSEKPIGVRVGHAERMRTAAQKAGCVFSVMFQQRTTPEIRKAREIVESGQLGQVRRTLLVEPRLRTQAYYDSGSWRATWAGEGGGVLMNQAPHFLDIFILLGGMPTRVRGVTRTLMHQIEVEDHAEAMLQYENDGVGYLCASTCEPGPGRIIQIWGEKGKLQLDSSGLSFTRYTPGVSEFSRNSTEMWGKLKSEEVELDMPECESGHHVILRNFARAILYGEELIAPGPEGERSLELANAIMLSSHRDEPVDIPIDREAFNELMEELCATSRYDESQAGNVRRETDPQFGP